MTSKTTQYCVFATRFTDKIPGGSTRYCFTNKISFRGFSILRQLRGKNTRGPTIGRQFAPCRDTNNYYLCLCRNSDLEKIVKIIGTLSLHELWTNEKRVCSEHQILVHGTQLLLEKKHSASSSHHVLNRQSLVNKDAYKSTQYRIENMVMN